MPNVEERLASLETRMDGIADLKALVTDLGRDIRLQATELRGDMRLQATELREEMRLQATELREEMRLQFTQTREDMNRQFDEARDDTNRRFEKTDRRLDILDQRGERQFLWLVGIQITGLIAVITALISVSR